MRAEARKELPALGDFTIDNLVDYDGFVELRMPELSCFENAMNGQMKREIICACAHKSAQIRTTLKSSRQMRSPSGTLADPRSL